MTTDESPDAGSIWADQADLAALLAEARGQRCAGRFAQAEAAFRQLLALHPDAAHARGELGSLLTAPGTTRRSRQRVPGGSGPRSRPVRGAQRPGRHPAGAGQHDQAIAQYEQVIARRPDIPDAHNNLGILLCEQGRLEEALPRFRRASTTAGLCRRPATWPGRCKNWASSMRPPHCTGKRWPSSPDISRRTSRSAGSSKSRESSTRPSLTCSRRSRETRFGRGLLQPGQRPERPGPTRTGRGPIPTIAGHSTGPTRRAEQSGQHPPSWASSNWPSSDIAGRWRCEPMMLNRTAIWPSPWPSWGTPTRRSPTSTRHWS